MAAMDGFNLKRLKEEQEKALLQTDNQLGQWNQFRSDYVALRDRLMTLPHKTTHNVMVPFGSLAFMPGKLVHTNEILVLLGDNYFVERSATQAADIVTRRIKNLDENIQALQKQREMLSPRTQFTSELIQMASGEGEQKEITEEYDEEQEQQWRERHREYLRRASEQQMKETMTEEKRKEQQTAKTDADYWDILDRLGEQEDARGEMERVEEEELEEQPLWEQHNHPELPDDPKGDEDSSSLDESEETEGEDKDSSDDEDEEDSERKVIRFSHTKQDDDSPSENSASKDTDNEGIINSPADIYRLVKMTPKSILKTPSRDMPVRTHRQKASCLPQEEQQKKVTFGREEDSAGGSAHGASMLLDEKNRAGNWSAADSEAQLQKLSRKSHVQAFRNTVVERELPAATAPQDKTSNTNSIPVSKPNDSAASSRPVSRFRAARGKTDGVSYDEQTPADSDVFGATGHGSGASSGRRPVSRFRASRMKQGEGS